MRSSSHLKRRQLLFSPTARVDNTRSTLARAVTVTVVVMRGRKLQAYPLTVNSLRRQESKVQSKAVPGRQGGMGGLKTACRIRSCFKTEKQPTWRKWWILSIPHCIVLRLATSLHLDLFTSPLKLEMSIISPPPIKLLLKPCLQTHFYKIFSAKTK